MVKYPKRFIFYPVGVLRFHNPFANGFMTNYCLPLTRTYKIKGADNIRILEITAGISVGEKEKCLEAGMIDYLHKRIIHSDVKKVLPF